jgi:hypothetical protein
MLAWHQKQKNDCAAGFAAIWFVDIWKKILKPASANFLSGSTRKT